MLQRTSLWLIVIVLGLAACSPQAELKFADLPAGDAAHGEQLFNEKVGGAPACNTCHAVVEGETNIGPSLVGVATTAETRKAGMTAGDYLVESIVKPAAYTVNRYGNTMYTQYRRALTDRDIADLVAYLLTLQ